MPDFSASRHTERDYLEMLYQEMRPWHDHLGKLLLSVNGHAFLELVNRRVPEIRRTVRVSHDGGGRGVIFFTDCYGEIPGDTLADKATVLARTLRVDLTGAL
ncbi:hypothetical protein [Actinomadura oligospora]|uniref:hypothetical protein n=1 Tax=Actinomadura oligospora TaxID=111804 RepID=UPI0004BC1207|nr:hypothetical protein [Actinomadura oligospora]